MHPCSFQSQFRKFRKIANLRKAANLRKMHPICRRRGLPGSMRSICDRHVILFCFLNFLWLHPRPSRANSEHTDVFGFPMQNSYFPQIHYFPQIADFPQIAELPLKQTRLQKKQPPYPKIRITNFFSSMVFSGMLPTTNTEAEYPFLWKSPKNRYFPQIPKIRTHVFCGKPRICGNTNLRNLRQRSSFPKY